MTAAVRAGRVTPLVLGAALAAVALTTLMLQAQYPQPTNYCAQCRSYWDNEARTKYCKGQSGYYFQACVSARR